VIKGFLKASPEETLGSLLAQLVKDANTRVYETGIASGPAGAGMSTTIVTCALRHDRAYLAHVGDSRCYLLRGSNLKQLTRDHTVANEQIRLGVISAQEGAEGGNRHILSRSLGSEMFVHVETSDIQVL